MCAPHASPPESLTCDGQEDSTDPARSEDRPSETIVDKTTPNRSPKLLKRTRRLSSTHYSPARVAFHTSQQRPFCSPFRQRRHPSGKLHNLNSQSWNPYSFHNVSSFLGRVGRIPSSETSKTSLFPAIILFASSVTCVALTSTTNASCLFINSTTFPFSNPP